VTTGGVESTSGNINDTLDRTTASAERFTECFGITERVVERRRELGERDARRDAIARGIVVGRETRR
jgi:hypothetical protein